MKLKYKSLIFLTLLLFCVGSVCATDPDNNITDNYNSTQDFKDIRVIIDNLEKNDVNQANEIQQLKDNNTQLDKRVKDLEYSKLTQSNRIKSLEIDIKNLEDSNKQLINSNKQLIDSNKALNVKIDNQNSIINELNNTVNNQSVTINSLKTDNEALNVKIDNQNSIINELNTTVNNQNNIINNQSVIINELNNKLDLQINEIKELNADKDKLNAEINKLNAEIKQTYEKLLSSPKKEDFDQLKKEIDNKNKQIDKLNSEINTLRAIISVNGKDVYNSLKVLSSTKNIKCGKYTFKLDDYLKIPLIKDGKDRVLKYKKSHGRLPNYVTIAGYEVPKNIYKKLYNL